MSRLTDIRTKVFTALSDFEYEGVTIPIFDEVVNPDPNITIPSISGAKEVYIILQDQQENYNEVQTVCSPRFNLSMTIRIITTWRTTGSKKLCEDIGQEVLYLLRDDRGTSLIDGIKEIEMISRTSQAEHTATEIAFTDIIILNFIQNG